MSAPSPKPWRVALAAWPVDLRDRWGHRANVLQDQGLSWLEAERQAFAEVQAERSYPPREDSR